MKTTPFFLLIGLALLCPHLSEGTIRTVSNNPDNPAQYSSFQAALDAAVVGDTIYVHGSSFTYGSVTVRKRLVLIGAGYSPNNQFGQPTLVGTVNLYKDSGSSDASASVITGFNINGNIQLLSGSLPVDNVRVFRNLIGSIYFYAGSNLSDGWVVYNNIINNLFGGSGSRVSPSATNIVIQNNIIDASIHGFSASSIIIDHNLFLGASPLSSDFYVVFTNNLFVRSSGTTFTNVTLCTFSNNLSDQSTIGAPSEYSPTNTFIATFIGSGGGSNSGAGNIVGVDPLFESVVNFDTYYPTANYRLKTTSPGHNAGTDGTDIGIYGGPYPFPSGGTVGSGYDTSPLPPIPQVTEVNIQNATLQPNGTLNVQVKAKVNN